MRWRNRHLQQECCNDGKACCGAIDTHAIVDAYRRDKESAQKWRFANNALTNDSMCGANPRPHTNDNGN